MGRLVRTAIVMTLACAAFASAETYRATLRGDREVPNPGDTDGAGMAFVTLQGTTVWYYIAVKDIAMPTAAHIHPGRAGASGGVAVSFAPTFTNPATDVYVAAGKVEGVDAGLVGTILGAPMEYYVNVHNGEFPGGALRGQLLGDGPSKTAFGSKLLGAREVPNPGDPDGRGFAGAIFDGTDVYFYLWVTGVDTPTAAHIHRGGAGEPGGVVLNFAPSFADGVAFGNVSADLDLVMEILENPESFYFNVHNAAFTGGALRGQVLPTEFVLHAPVVARNPGQGTSVFSTDMRIGNVGDLDATVFAEWYPANTTGLEAPEATVPVAIAAGGEAILDDVVGTLFGANERGAIRLVSLYPIHAVSRIFNDQRGSGSGTFGQFSEALGLAKAFRSGMLLLGSHKTRSSGEDYRLNLGYFNPSPFPVEVTLTAKNPEGSEIGTPTAVVLPGYSNDVDAYFDIITGVPSAQRAQTNLFIVYSADRPVFIFSSQVDNVTDDGLHQPALRWVPPGAPVAVATNAPPDGTIVAPASDVSIGVGGTVSFEGAASDPDGDPVSVLWSFGDGATSDALVPGDHTYATEGVYTVTFTATDSHGMSDPSPPARSVTVSSGSGSNSPPNGTIVSPPGHVSIYEGQSVNFTGSASDPDGDSVTVLWDFGDGNSSTELSPGPHTFIGAGNYTVTFTATDGNGLPDPTPETRTVEVLSDYDY